MTARLLYPGLALAGLFVASAACAIEPSANTVSPAPETAETGPSGLEGRFYISTVSSSPEPELQNESEGYGLSAGMTWRSARYGWLSYDFDVLAMNRKYDTTVLAPPIGTVDDRMRLTTGVMSGGLRASYPSTSSAQLYLLGGLALISNTLTATGSIFGLPASMDDTDTELNYYYGAGFVAGSGKMRIFAEYRYLSNEASFSDFYANDVDLSAEIVSIGLSLRF